MSRKKRFSRLLSIILIASMVLCYNSSFYLLVWAAEENEQAAAEEMIDDAVQNNNSESDEGSDADLQKDAQDEEPQLNEESDDPEDTSIQEETKDSAAEDMEEVVSDEQDEETASGDMSKESVTEKQDEDPADEETVTDEQDEETASRTEYVYSDKSIKVTAIISDASAVPDNAELVVTAVTPQTKGYNYDSYMAALNEDAGEESYTKNNTLLYDIAFIVDEGGSRTEVQPEDGSVTIKAEFLNKQLSKKLGAENADDIQLIHLPLDENIADSVDTTAEATDIKASDIQVEKIDAEIKVGRKQKTTFDTDSLSVWAWNNGSVDNITIPETVGAFGPGDPQYEIDGTFGELANFGVVGFSEIEQNDHLHSNFATKNYVMNSGDGFGLREERHGVTNTHKEIYYIGESITGNVSNTPMEIHVPDTLLVLGHELGQNGILSGNADDHVYDINVSGRSIHITSGDTAAEQDGGNYVAKSIRQEPQGSHFVDLDAMKEKAEALSNKLADRTASLVNVTQGANNVLIVEREAATLSCMNFNASDFADKTLMIDEANVRDIKHLLIINIDAAGADSVTLPQLELMNASGRYNGEVVEWTQGNIIVNVIDSTKSDNLFRGTVNTVNGAFRASILAPDANVIVNASVNGQVFGDKVVINTELHRDSITFTNEIPSVGGLRVAKTMDGSSVLSGEYSFILEGLNYNGHQAPMPDGSQGNTKTVPAEADGLVTFGFLSFNENEFNSGVRDYRYKVSEVIPDGATDIGDNYKLSGDVAYDANTYIVEVHTKRSSSGGIGIQGYTVYKEDGTTVVDEMDYDSGKTGVVTFANKTVSNGSVKATLKVKKSFDGDEWPESGFGFKLTKVGVDYGSGIDTSGISNMPPEDWRLDPNQYEGNRFYDTLYATKDKPTVEYRTMEYNTPGDYHYTIKEIIPDDANISEDGKKAEKNGIIYDNTTHNVVVSVIDIGGGKKTVSVKYDGKDRLVISNEVEKTTGILELTKTIKGAITEEEAAGALTFEVTTGEGESKKWLGKDGTLSDDAVVLTLADFDKTGDNEYKLTIETEELGAYKVTETTTGPEGKPVTVSYKVNDGDAQEGAAADAEIKKDETTTVAFEDDYKKNTEPEKKGDLVITKTIGGDVTAEELEEAALKFEVKTSDGKWLDKDGNVSEIKIELTLGEEDGFVTEDGGKTWTKTFKDVPVDTYTVTETNALIDGYTLKESSKTEATAEVKAGEKATAELEDIYTKKVGKLVITKTIDGDNLTVEEFEGALKFTVQNGDGKYLDKDGNLSDEKVELTLKDDGFVKDEDGKYTKTYENIPAGTYTVKETNSAVEGYDLVTDQSTTSDTAYVVNAGTSKAELKDVYEQQKGDLVITKTVDGDNLTEEEFEGALKFTVRNADGKYLDKDGNLSDEVVELTLKDSGFVKGEDGKYTKTFENVAVGTYTVKETNSAVEGYDLVTEQSTTEGSGKVEDGQTATVELKDVYEEFSTTEEKGDLVIIKTIGGDVTAEELAEAALKFEVKTSDGKWLDKDGKISETRILLTLGEADGFVTEDGGKTWTKTFKDVPVDSYTVTETNALIDGYKLKDTSNTEATAEVKAGESATAELNDDYTKTEESGSEDETPAKEEVTPEDEDKTPEQEEVTPEDEDKTPEQEEVTPEDEEETPEQEEVTPEDEEDDSPAAEKKTQNGVNTGDESLLEAWLIMVAASLSGLAAMIFRRRKSH